MTINTAVYETYVTNGDGLPLDLIIWRRYRRKTPGLVEATYAFNPGLAQLGMFLPRGTQIKIPVVAPTPVTQLPVVRLW